MEQLGPGIAHQSEQLGHTTQQLPALIQLVDSVGQLPKQLGETVRPILVVHFIVLGHTYLRAPEGTRVKFAGLQPINVTRPARARSVEDFAPHGAP